MKRDAEAHAAEDKKRREVIDLKNQGENLAYQTEKTLKEHGDKVAADVRGEIESGARTTCATRSRATTATASRRRWRTSTTVSHKLGRRDVQGQAGARAAPGGAGPAPEAQTDRGTTGGGGKKKDDDVIDAEYEVKE